MDRKFGRHFIRDTRDKKFSVSRMSITRTYRYWSDHSWLGDQGESPACVGFSWVGWLANYPLKQWLDPFGLYELAKQNDEWDGDNYDGTSIRAGAKVLKALGFIEKYKWTKSLQRLIECVLEVGPVVIGTNWYAGMEEPDSRMFIRLGGESFGGHAYLINGVNAIEEKFRVRNSWGTNWGYNGRAWISFKDMKKLLKEDESECCLPIEKMVGPT